MLKGSEIVKLPVFKEGFDAVIEQDFNPDFVQLFGMDMFESGFETGLKYGVIGSCAIAAGYFLGKKLEKVISKHFRKNEESE